MYWLKYAGNEEMLFERLQYDDVMTISLRNQHALGRSVIGETQLRVDKYYDYKEAEEVFELFSDEEHTVRRKQDVLGLVVILFYLNVSVWKQRRMGEVTLNIHLLSPEDPAIRAAKLAEEAKKQQQGASGGASAERSGSKAEKSSEKESVSADPVGKLTAEQIDQLDFDGGWKMLVVFDYSDLGLDRRGSTKSSNTEKEVKSVRDISAGVKLSAFVSLEKKSGNHLRGTCSSFPPFKEDGNVTGSIQKGSNKISLQLQTLDGRDVNSAFKFTFTNMEPSGAVVGSFSAHEISDTAGTASGKVRMRPAGEWSSNDAEDPISLET